MNEVKRSKKLISNAKSQARRQPRPPSIPRRCWGDCQDLLVELAAHVPNIWPAQGPSKRTKKGESLVERTGQPLITVRRNLKRLEGAGLIIRKVRDYGDRWDGTEYFLPWWQPLSDTPVSPGVARPLPLTLSGSCRSDRAVAAAQNELPTVSSPAEKKERGSSPNTTPLRGVVSDDDGSSSSPEAGWESNRLEAALAALGGGGQVHDPDPETGWCEGCERKHNRFPGLAEKGTGCVECGEDVPRLTGHLSGTSPIHIACEVSPSASQERAALEARLREVRTIERKEVQGARVLYDHTSQGVTYRMATFPDDYVFPDWWIREGCR